MFFCFTPAISFYIFSHSSIYLSFFVIFSHIFSFILQFLFLQDRIQKKNVTLCVRHLTAVMKMTVVSLF